jgi:hypothetical protein
MRRYLRRFLMPLTVLRIHFVRSRRGDPARLFPGMTGRFHASVPGRFRRFESDCHVYPLLHLRSSDTIDVMVAGMVDVSTRV